MKYSLFTRFSANGGYWPAQSLAGPEVSPDAIYRGVGFWVRPGGRLKPVKGAAAISATNVGSRIYPLDVCRGEIEGGLVSGKLPKESLVRYQNSALFYLSENTSQQVRINESTSTPYTLTGVTTSATAGKLKVAILSGTTFTPYDAGLDAPMSAGTVTTEAGGTKSMDGIVSIVACARRISTDTTSNPSPASVQTLVAAGSNRIRVVLPAAQSGSDGWFYAGTEWGRGNFGPWKLIRQVRSVIEGTVGIATLAMTGTGTRFTRDLRVGDVVTVNSVDYTIATITSDTAATVAAGADQTAPKTATMKEIVLDWRNGELTDLIEFNNDTPPILDGLMLFNNVPFGWKGNVLYPSKIGNPESFPRELARSTQSGADIIHALAGDARIYLLTTNGLEVVTFTQNDADPFLIRQTWSFGFSSPSQAVVAEGTLYAAIGTSSGSVGSASTTTGVKIVRTQIDDSPDLEFSAKVESDMLSWSVSGVTMGVDPANGAVLAIYQDGTDTTILPYMLQQNVWSLPQKITGQRVMSAAAVSNTCALICYNGTNFRVYAHEGGSGASIDKYVAWPFVDTPGEGLRKIIKRIKVTGDVDSLYVYKGEPSVAIPDVTSTGAATLGPVTLSGALRLESMIQTNVQNCQAYSVRLDSNDSDAEIVEVGVWGIINEIGR